MTDSLTLSEFILQQQHACGLATGEFSQILAAISLAAKIVQREISKAGLLDIGGSSGQQNIQGEEQQKLDLYANEKFKSALSARGHVCGLASEEEENFVEFAAHNHLSSTPAANNYLVAIDPIDGSSNIDVSIPVGTIFSIYRRQSAANSKLQLSDFLQPGHAQLAAGYVIYGSSTMLVYTTGKGVHGFTFDASIGEFYLSHENIRFPPKAAMYSINEGNALDFSPAMNRYIHACKSGGNCRGMPYSARYVGSLVADFHRNLIKGGIYLYPATQTLPQGKLRLLYECHPLAFIAEQAGGKCSDGQQRMLAIQAGHLHQRSPFIVGPRDLVDEAEAFLNNSIAVSN